VHIAARLKRRTTPTSSLGAQRKRRTFNTWYVRAGLRAAPSDSDTEGPVGARGLGGGPRFARAVGTQRTTSLPLAVQACGAPPWTHCRVRPESPPARTATHRCCCGCFVLVLSAIEARVATQSSRGGGGAVAGACGGGGGRTTKARARPGVDRPPPPPPLPPVRAAACGGRQVA